MTEEITRTVNALPVARATFRETGLELPEDFSFDEWQSLGQTLQRMERSVMWWLGDWLRFGERKYGETYSQALEMSGYAPQTLMNAVWVANQVEVSRRRENLTWSHHTEVASLAPSEQIEWLEKAEANDWSTRDLRREVRGERRPTFGAIAQPEGSYQVLYADPPWRYEYVETESRAIENHYPTMELEEIKALAVPAADDAVLFLWATSPKLNQAIEVMEAWGFEYRTSMVWVKDQIGMGYYARQRHECLLIGKKGEPSVPDPQNRPASVLEAPRGKHSAKPEAFYRIIERMYPLASKVELFSRSSRDGWAVWGNEVAA